MLSRLTGQADLCRERALSCYRRAGTAQHQGQAREYREMARRWVILARQYQLAEQVSGFLHWDAQRLKAPDELRP
jgi:hypothetical protein